MRTMTTSLTRRALKQQRQARRRRLVSLIVAPAVAVAGMAGLGVWGATTAAASGLAPSVGAAASGTYLAGEDLTLQLTFSSNPLAGDQYNLSAGVVIPADAHIVSTGTLGAATVYPAGTVLPGVIASQPSQTLPDNCADLGLEDAASPGSCQVPTGSTYLVFQNISDLPEGASLSHSLTLRPDASVYDIGAQFPFRVNAYTNADPRFLPVFPGSTGVSSSAAQEGTSNGGVTTGAVPVSALRVEKSEPSPESELLRGVHQNTTTYTLRIWHTGEGDLDDVIVTDWIPAGLEYLGLGGVDNTTNANGNRGGGATSVEYDGASRLTATPAPGGSGAIANTGGETVETVLDGGSVYTRVTWNIGELLKTGHADFSILDPIAQDFTASAATDTRGEAGYFEIRYRAAVPLFENTLDFGYTPDTTGQQTANLDNNRGASTRHGDDDGNPVANSYTNRAEARGVYLGRDGDLSVPVSDEDTETIDAVDVRVLKSVDVDGGGFVQGGTARFTLNIATSEYVSADLEGAGDRIFDILSDGMCAIFPADTAVTPGASPHADVPQLVIGPAGGAPAQSDLTAEQWNDALGGYGVGSDCHYPSAKATNPADALLGASLSSLGFDPATGRFSLELDLAADALPAGLSDGHTVRYSAALNTRYAGQDNEHGSTTSADIFRNDVEIHATTHAIAPLEGLENSGGTSAGSSVGAGDDSGTTFHANLALLAKHVLKRSAGVPARTQIADQAESDWVKTPDENTPFMVGDEVWYRIKITSPHGADVRNPRFTDFLPAGVSFDTSTTGTGRYASTWITVPSDGLPWIGDCAPSAPDLTPAVELAEWLEEFVPNPLVNGNVLTFNIGSADCFDGTDRFMPLDTPLEIYLKVTVTEPSTFATVDLPQNLAKYQQQNVDGQIFFLRDHAEIEVDRTPRLLKGIHKIDDLVVVPVPPAEPEQPLPAEGDEFDSDIDGIEVVQGERVTYRLDITAPFGTTAGYVIYDVLPAGILAADIDPAAFTALSIEDGIPGSTLIFAEAPVVLDAGDPGYDELRLKAGVDGRSVIVWSVDPAIPGSSKAVLDEAGDEVSPAVVRGFTLGYTVTIPDGGPESGGAAAQITQIYDNDASIVQFDTQSNGIGSSTVFIDGSENVATVPGTLTEGQFRFDDAGNDTSDPSRVFLPDASIHKTLISTEIGPDNAATPPGGENDLDPNNPDDVIVHGENATFEYTVTIPARTSVRDGVLSDNGLFRWTGNPNVLGRQIPYLFVPGSAVFTGPDEAFDFTGFTIVDAADDPDHLPGTMVFPAEYHNATDEAQTFSVRITVRIRERDASNPTYNPNFGNGVVLTNTAEFDYSDPDGSGPRTLSDTATVTYREPNPTLAKAATHVDGVAVADPADPVVRPGSTVTYRLIVSNSSSRPALFDGVVHDCIPAHLSSTSSFISNNGTAAVVPDVSCSLNESGDVVLDANGIPSNSGSGTLIRWQLANPVEPGTANRAILDYTLTVDPDAGAGLLLRNGAHLRGHTLPGTVGGDATAARRGDRDARAREDVRLTSANVTKSVSPEAVPVGDTVTYTLTANFPADANYYDVTLADTLPAGLEYLETTNVEVDWADAPNAPAVVSPVAPAGSSLAWTFTGGDFGASPGADFATWSQPRSIVITFTAKVTDHVLAPSPRNTVGLGWNGINDNAASRETEADEAVFAIVNPVVGIVKKVGTDPAQIDRDAILIDPDEELHYELTVTNTGDTDAFHITVVDRVPAGVIVDPDSIATVQGVTGVISGAGETGGGIITWTGIPGPLAVHTGGADPAEAITLGYSARLAPSIQLRAADFPYTNIVNVTRYESFAEDGWVYTPPVRNPDGTSGTAGPLPGGGTVPAANDDADVTPLFPNVVPDKTVTVPRGTDPAGEGKQYGIAVVGVPFGWNLTVTNSGAGAAEGITVTDVLPENWVYVPGNVTLDGVPFADPAVHDPASRTIVWTAEQLAAVLPLASGGSFTIAFTATPTAAARDDSPGTGILVAAHTNTMRVTATDTTGADENGDGDYVGEESTAKAFIAEADLRLVKEATGGTRNGLHGLPADSWVPGQANGPDYEQPRWRITVTNQGPDASEGPFVFVDTTTMPAGVTLGVWEATHYPTAADAAAGTDGTALTVTPTVDGFTVDGDVGGQPLSLLANGSNRIVVTASVLIPADATTPDDEPLHNLAGVTGATFESTGNLGDNTDEDEKPLHPIADLQIVKAVSTASPSAGGPITWQLTVTNLGPSVSSGAGAPITVTDEIPAGVTGVTATSNDDWQASLEGGDPIPVAGVGAGTVILWTYQHDEMPVGATAPVTLSGTILSSFVGTLENEAEVRPGDTPDPVDENNTDEVDVPVGDDTNVSILKSVVVWDQDAGAWVPADGDNFTLTPGEPISYRIDVHNYGAADAREVVVTDIVPTGLSYRAPVVDVDANGEPTGAPSAWTRGTSGSNDTFSLGGTLSAGATVSFVVTYDTAPSTDTAVSNCAEADAVNDRVWHEGLQRSCVLSGGVRDADLTIAKIAKTTRGGTETMTAVAGSALWYQLVVTNLGPSDSSAPIDVHDLLPAGFAYVGGSSQIEGTAVADPSAGTVSSPDGDRQSLVWENITGGVDLAEGDTATITFQVSIDPDLRAGGYLNEAAVTGPDDNDVTNNADDASVILRTQTAMTIAKVVEDGPWIAGTNVQYTLTITNTGLSSAPAEVTDTLPSGLTMVSMSGTGWTCDFVVGDQDGSCTYTANDGLHPVAATTITVEALIGPGAAALEQPLVNVAELRWSDSDGSYRDEDDDEIEVTRIADLGIAKTAVDENGTEVSTVVAGTSLWYRIVVRNEGPSDAIGPIVVHDELPAGVSFAGLSDDALLSWSAVSDGADPATITFTRLGDAGILNGQPAPAIVFEVHVDADIAAAASLRNDAAIDEDTLEENSDPTQGLEAPDQDFATVTVAREVDVAIDKRHDAEQVRIGDELEFTLEVVNNGPSQATGITVTDTVPAGLEVLSAPGDDVGLGWTLISVTPADDDDPAAGARVVAAYAEPLDPENMAPLLTLRTLVHVSAYATVTNVAGVEVTEPDTVPENNLTEDPVIVPPMATLVITKEAVGTFRVGAEATYLITVRNDGPTEDPGPIVITDTLPNGLRFVSASGPDATCGHVAGTVTCELLGALAVDASTTIQIRVSVRAAALPEVVNTAVVDSPTEQTPDAVLEDTVSTPVIDQGISSTGSETPLLWASLALLMVLAGGVLLVVRRRRPEVVAA